MLATIETVQLLEKAESIGKQILSIQKSLINIDFITINCKKIQRLKGKLNHFLR